MANRRMCAAAGAAAVALVVTAQPTLSAADTGQAAAPPPPLTGQWNLDTISDRGSTKFTPSARFPGTSEANPRDDGILDSDTTVKPASRVAIGGAGSLRFPGWHRDEDPARDGVQVHPTKSSVRVPHRLYFDPLERQRFVVSAFIRPDDTTAPGSPVQPGEAPNILQKGLKDDPDGQWKMSIFGDMRPVCAFRGDHDDDDATPTRQRVVDANAGDELVPGQRYRVECELQRQLVSLRVYEVDPAAPQPDLIISEDNPIANTDPFVIDNDAQVWIGKKPDDTSAANTYAGAIDNVTIRRSAT